MIRWARDGALATATLDRPERRNALTAAGAFELAGHLQAATDARVVVVQGNGGAFCAGADLDARFDDVGGGDQDAFRPAFEALTAAIGAFPGIVVAAVDGPALGAGTQLAAWCDLRVAGDTASFGIPAGRIGAHLSASGIARLVDVVGISAAEWLLLSSATMTADEALRVGLVHQRVSDASAGARVLAAELLTQAPLTLAGHKAALREMGTVATMTEVVKARIAALEVRAFASEDLQEGLAARREKRSPEFRGE